MYTQQGSHAGKQNTACNSPAWVKTQLYHHAHTHEDINGPLAPSKGLPRSRKLIVANPQSPVNPGRLQDAARHNQRTFKIFSISLMSLRHQVEKTTKRQRANRDLLGGFWASLPRRSAQVGALKLTSSKPPLHKAVACSVPQLLVSSKPLFLLRSLEENLLVLRLAGVMG